MTHPERTAALQR